MTRGLRTWAARCLSALEAISAAIIQASRLPSLERYEEDLRALSVRLDEVERTRVSFEAEMLGLVRRAEGERRTARAAEERVRRAESRLETAEDLAAGDAGTVEELAAAYAAQSGPERLPSVPQVVGSGRTSRRAAALAAKWRA